MKKTLILVICGLLGLGLSAQIENSLLWKISGKGIKKNSYLYGTFHIGDERAFFMMETIDDLLNKCKFMAGELNHEDELSNPLALLGEIQMKGTTLEDLYTTEEYQYVESRLQELLGPMFIITKGMKPIFISTLLTEDLNALGSGKLETGNLQQVLDDKIQSKAREKGLEIFGLETAEEALQSLNGISLEEQAKMLYDELKNMEENEDTDYMEQLLDLYLTQNINGMMLMLDATNVSFNFEEFLVTQRNKKFTEGLIELMKEKPTFCAVGALHLPGDQGMVTLIRNLGYKVEPVYVK